MSHQTKNKSNEGKGYQTKLTMFIDSRSKPKEEKLDKSKDKDADKVEKKP